MSLLSIWIQHVYSMKVYAVIRFRYRLVNLFQYCTYTPSHTYRWFTGDLIQLVWYASRSFDWSQRVTFTLCPFLFLYFPNYFSLLHHSASVSFSFSQHFYQPNTHTHTQKSCPDCVERIGALSNLRFHLEISEPLPYHMRVSAKGHRQSYHLGTWSKTRHSTISVGLGTTETDMKHKFIFIKRNDHY